MRLRSRRRLLNEVGLSSVYMAVFLLAVGLGLYGAGRITMAGLIFYISVLLIIGAIIKTIYKAVSPQSGIQAPTYGLSSAAKRFENTKKREMPFARPKQAATGRDMGCATALITVNLVLTVSLYFINLWFFAFRFHGAPRPPFPSWMMALTAVLNIASPLGAITFQFGTLGLFLNLQTVAVGIVIIGSFMFYLGHYRPGAWISALGSLCFLPAGIIGLAGAVKSGNLESKKDDYKRRGRRGHDYKMKNPY